MGLRQAVQQHLSWDWQSQGSSSHQAYPSPISHPSNVSLAHRLTAFVLKSFGQARAYVAIEERHIQDALHWLQKQQQQTGCFRSVGKLFNNALQVGRWAGVGHGDLGWSQHVPGVWSRQWGSPRAGGMAWQDPSPAVPFAGRRLGRALAVGLCHGCDAGAGALPNGEDDPIWWGGDGCWGRESSCSGPPPIPNWAQLVSLGRTGDSEQCLHPWAGS